MHTEHSNVPWIHLSSSLLTESPWQLLPKKSTPSQGEHIGCFVAGLSYSIGSGLALSLHLLDSLHLFSVSLLHLLELLHVHLLKVIYKKSYSGDEY